MDSLIKSLVLYTDGLDVSRTGIMELSQEICDLSLGMKDKIFEGNPKKFFSFDSENSERNAFMCNYLGKIIQGEIQKLKKRSIFLASILHFNKPGRLTRASRVYFDEGFGE